ncbi:MAG: CorA family divalent cation transporter [Patescibacteria group bacterium]
MITTRSFMNQTWIDLNSPTKEEADSLVLTHNIDPSVAKDLVAPTPAQHAQDRGKSIYAILHLPTFKRSRSICDTQEVDIILSADNLITARYDSIDALHYFAKQIEVSEILNKGENVHLFFGMMKEVYNAMRDELSYMEDQMKEIEKNIFDGQEKEMVFAISNTGRNILNFRRIVDPHGGIFEFLKENGTEKFGREFGTQTKILIEDWRHVMRIVNNQIDLITQLRETNNSMLSTKQNEVMKILTILAFVTFPLSLIASIFGMNTSFIPIVGWQNDFWIVIGIMFFVSIAMFVYFKYKRWV